jgi:hypothetical protein
MQKLGLLKVNMQQGDPLYEGDSDSSDEERSKQKRRKSSFSKLDKIREKLENSNSSNN